MAVMRIMFQGHTTVTWDTEDKVQVEAAETAFKAWQEKGYRPFAITRPEIAGEPISEFSPTVEEILFVPPVAGG